MQSKIFIHHLLEQSQLILNTIEQLAKEDLSYLTWKTEPGVWNILECVEHLNLYYNFYLPEITKAIQSSSTSPDENFKSGLLGGYFAKIILPKQKLNKMKTAKDKNPLDAKLDKSVIQTFIKNQSVFIELIEKSKAVNLNKVRVKVSIAKFIKINLGDTFQFLINHNLRHIAQIERIQQQIKSEISHSIVPPVL